MKNICETTKVRHITHTCQTSSKDLYLSDISNRINGLLNGGHFLIFDFGLDKMMIWKWEKFEESEASFKSREAFCSLKFLRIASFHKANRDITCNITPGEMMACYQQVRGAGNWIISNKHKYFKEIWQRWKTFCSLSKHLKCVLG